jgi:uncharacterized protein (TIGR03437 family)
MYTSHTAMRVLLGLALWPLVSWGQKPLISPGGVVNVASYSVGTPASSVAGNVGGKDLPSGAIGSIFGLNLAASTQSAATVPLPVSLGGTTVTMDGVAAPLFFVSPSQINFQVPSSGLSGLSGVVVTTAAGASDPYPLNSGGNPWVGVFTLDGSGCGRGDVLNVTSDGRVSLNSPANSVSPGEYLEVFGTGEQYLPFLLPPDGSPAPSSPLVWGEYGSSGEFDLTQFAGGPPNWFGGRAPGLIGVDQFNLQVPATAREGCAVPFQVVSGNISQPVTIAIRNGGGQCVDPPEAGYGQVTWERTVNTDASHTVTESDTVTVSLQTSPGKQAPPAPIFTGSVASSWVYLGPSCPIPGYRSLSAGTVAIQGPGFSPTAASVAPLQQGQVSGLTVYQATLPAGAIQAGSFTVSAGGGADMGAFQSGVHIGAGIQITTDLAGIVFPCNKPVTINWTGGDPNAWVTITKVSHNGIYDAYNPVQARVSAGTAALPAGINPLPGTCGSDSIPIDLVIEVDPDPSETAAFSATGLSLGGQHTWRYIYRFPAFLQL